MAPGRPPRVGEARSVGVGNPADGDAVGVSEGVGGGAVVGVSVGVSDGVAPGPGVSVVG